MARMAYHLAKAKLFGYLIHIMCMINTRLLGKANINMSNKTSKSINCKKKEAKVIKFHTDVFN